MKKLFLVIVLISAMFNQGFSHCEVPCGIYGDSVRVALIKEHIKTIAKSMKQINKLSKEGEKNYNQLVRWVINKEEHAKKIQNIVSQYFLHQRIKLPKNAKDAKANHYYQKLELLHKLQVYSMKTKQTTDLKFIKRLNETINKFEKFF